MEAIFSTIITISLYASFVGLVIILLKRILNKRLNPKWHFLIWIVLILKLIVPYGPESEFSLFNAVPQAAAFTYNSSAEQSINPSIFREEPTQPQIIPPQSNLNIPQNIESEVSNTFGFIDKAEKVLPYIWLFGAVGLSLWFLGTNFLLYLRLKQTRREVPESLYLILEECKQRMGVKRKIEITVQGMIGTPSIFGVITPRILISPQTLKLDNKQISYILLHELAHYKQKDLLTNYLLLGLQVIHWFNPVIWYCFMMIRRDMEIAADHRVLSVFRQGEEKEYGKALLTVLESFTSYPRVLPKLIGMADDKKTINRRINMIRTAEIFQRKKGLFLLTGILSVVILSIVLLTNPLTATDPGENGEQKESYADILLKYKNPYVGDASNVGNLLSQLSYAELRQGISLQTEKPPYGITVNYDFTSMADLSLVEEDLYNSALIIFTLISNVEHINFNMITNDGEHKLQFSRDHLQKNYDKDLREYTQDEESFRILLNSIVYPKLDQAISKAILEQGNYLKGEVATEGHVLLGTEEKDGVITAYTIASFGYFGFENGIFTTISGSGAIPTVITFKKNEQGQYSIISYQEPLDGAGYLDSLKNMFPEKYLKDILSGEKKYPELAQQLERQAAEYLRSIGRTATISTSHVEKKLLNLSSIPATNKFAELSKYDPFLNNCPYWIGTREKVEDGVRYIYQTQQSKTEDGYDLVIFSKRQENGTVVREAHYKIIGDDPQLIHGLSKPSITP